jgi:hypothetical protein
MIRAYKRKKAEVETLRNQCLSLESEVDQLRQLIEANKDDILRAEQLHSDSEQKLRQSMLRETKLKASHETLKRELDLVKSQM